MSKEVDYERIIKEIKYNRLMQKKRLYEQAKRQQNLKVKTKSGL